MTVLHLKSKAGADGRVHLGEMDVGVPHADVEVTVSVSHAASADNVWKAEMRVLLDNLGEVHVEEYARTAIRDPWKEQ